MKNAGIQEKNIIKYISIINNGYICTYSQKLPNSSFTRKFFPNSTKLVTLCKPSCTFSRPHSALLSAYAPAPALYFSEPNIHQQVERISGKPALLQGISGFALTPSQGWDMAKASSGSWHAIPEMALLCLVWAGFMPGGYFLPVPRHSGPCPAHAKRAIRMPLLNDRP